MKPDRVRVIYEFLENAFEISGYGYYQTMSKPENEESMDTLSRIARISYNFKCILT
jgi:hypothetical protein